MHSLFQVEYAIEAVKLGSTAVGIQTREGVVLAIEKRLTSALLEPSSVEKVLEIDSHIGAAFSGLIGGNAVSGVLPVFCMSLPMLTQPSSLFPLVFFLSQMPEHWSIMLALSRKIIALHSTR